MRKLCTLNLQKNDFRFTMVYKTLLKPLLFRMEAEKAHETVYRFAETSSGNELLKFLARLIYGYSSPRLGQNLWGLHFPNPVGLAAGFDKNGSIPEIMEALGFGYVEVGSVTAQPSTGNPRPRLFRLPEDRALINRMGLNNDGASTVAKRLGHMKTATPLGINIAKTHDSEITGDRAVADYLQSYREVRETADYITLNISCPNTSDGKTFEEPAALDELLSALKIKADARTVPTLVKFSSDLEREELARLVEICEKHRINGYVASNTSSRREGLETDSAVLERIGNGGVSGKPLLARSIRNVRWIREITNAQKPIIGVGGVDSFEAALAMLRSGADLVQVYTGLIYEGPALLKTINRELARYLENRKLDTILQLPRNSG